MSKRLVLIDSSLWISHLIGQSAASRVVGELLREDRVAVNAVIRVELLTGARSEAQYAELEDTLLGLHSLFLSDAVWRRAERLRFQLKLAGKLVPVADVVIACCALVYDCEILHADRHFDQITHIAPLRIYGK